MKIEVERAVERIIRNFDAQEAAEKKRIIEEQNRKREAEQRQKTEVEYGYGYGCMPIAPRIISYENRK